MQDDWQSARRCHSYWTSCEAWLLSTLVWSASTRHRPAGILQGHHERGLLLTPFRPHIVPAKTAKSYQRDEDESKESCGYSMGINVKRSFLVQTASTEFGRILQWEETTLCITNSMVGFHYICRESIMRSKLHIQKSWRVNDPCFTATWRVVATACNIRVLV